MDEENATDSVSQYMYDNESAPEMESKDALSVGSLLCAYLLIIVSVIGSVGNIIAAWIFTRSSIMTSINTLLAGQAVIDTMLLVTSTPLFTCMSFHMYYNSEPLFTCITVQVLYTYPLMMTAHTATVWTMVVITFERFLAVCRPLQARVVCRVRYARAALITVVFSSFIYNLCRYWEYEKITTINGFRLNPVLRKNNIYVNFYYYWCYFLIVYLIPFLVLVFINGAIVKCIRRARRERRMISMRQNTEHQTAMMMVVITSAFFVCNSMSFILKALEAAHVSKCEMEEFCFTRWPIFFFLIDLNNLLVSINSGLPFFIFYSFSHSFRFRFCKLFGLHAADNGSMRSSIILVRRSSSRPLLAPTAKGGEMVTAT